MSSLWWSKCDNDHGDNNDDDDDDNNNLNNSNNNNKLGCFIFLSAIDDCLHVRVSLV